MRFPHSRPVRQLLLVLAVLAAAVGSASAHPAAATPLPHHGSGYIAPPGTKINVMGEWAHPDDDTSIIGPCGVWHRKYGTRCGIIQITRGEGGGNAYGTESGQALGLRRENEDRIAHYRSGTVDLFYVDRVDFFYNQSAPLTQQIWDEQETLRRVTRIIRTTQPDIFIGFTPTLAAGHGNHQQAGRLIWEGVRAAADPTMFPDQLTGPHAVSTWQVKKIFSGGSTTGTGGTPTSPNCAGGFIPAATNPSTVAGVWTGYDSPYRWPKGNLQGRPAGTPKIWQQVADEGRSAYPTQSRTMYMGTSAPGCSRFAMTDSWVPFQPNTRADGSANPKAGLDDAIFFGASKPDPGGLPLGTLEYLSFSDFYVVPGQPFTVTLHLRAGKGVIPNATARLMLPAGWTSDGQKRLAVTGRADETTVDFTVTPAAEGAIGQYAKIAAQVTAGRASGYTDNVVQLVAPAEGRYQRWGKWAEYDSWLQDTAPAARRLGRSDAVATVVLGRSMTIPVDVHNWSDRPQRGRVSLELPADFTADATTKDYGLLAPGKTTTVTFSVTNTDTTLPAGQQASIPITTTAQGSSQPSTDTLAVSIVPATSIRQVSGAPVVDGHASAAEYPGPKLDIGRIWQGASGCATPADCGESADGPGTYAKVSWSDDALYFFVHVLDDYQSYAVTPAECVAHWLADSVEFQIDPQGNASQDAMDTADTFKLGVFPYTDDPDNSNGNGVNGPCWERDADNHQGYATGPLADTVQDAPNAAGVEVASTATWVGSNSTTVDHAYTGGGYDLEVKIPIADLPEAIDPDHLAINITPYDNDDTAADGTTELRHIDISTRLAWSAFGSVQSDPYRWGVATMPGYTPPEDQPTQAPPPILGHTNLSGADSPQTIIQSARNGVPIAGRPPVTARNGISVKDARVTPTGASLVIDSRSSGTAHVFAWHDPSGDIPVYSTSCPAADDPPPDYGFTPCATSDGGIPAWSPDMSGHALGDRTVTVHPGRQLVTIPLDSAARDQVRTSGRLLVSYVSDDGLVQALDLNPR
ncbi:LmbE family protein [Microlunatus sp. Gsoil 973]|nr:LmbE family protein [Microlunatus sp. Gsoil 973]